MGLPEGQMHQGNAWSAVPGASAPIERRLVGDTRCGWACRPAPDRDPHRPDVRTRDRRVDPAVSEFLASFGTILGVGGFFSRLRAASRDHSDSFTEGEWSARCASRRTDFQHVFRANRLISFIGAYRDRPMPVNANEPGHIFS
jgi:hypothetical protein